MTGVLTPVTDQGTAGVVALDDVRVVTNDVWTSFLASAEPLAWAPAPLSDVDVVRAAVDIRGEWSGTVTLELSPAAALDAARTMLGHDDVDRADVLDALGELVNMIGGNIKSLLPSGSVLGLPMVSPTPVPIAVPAGSTEHCRADLTWAGTTIVVRVWSHATDKDNAK